MSRTIWKFDVPVQDSVLVSMPQGADIIHVGQQRGDIIDVLQVWAIVDPQSAIVRRQFFVRGTGHPMGDAVGFAHVGTVLTAAGRLVWHLFDGGESPCGAFGRSVGTLSRSDDSESARSVGRTAETVDREHGGNAVETRFTNRPTARPGGENSCGLREPCSTRQSPMVASGGQFRVACCAIAGRRSQPVFYVESCQSVGGAEFQWITNVSVNAGRSTLVSNLAESKCFSG